MSDQKDWKMTAKLPLLLVGIAVALFGWFLTLKGTRQAVVAGGVLILVGAGMVGWSESIHNWCVPTEQKWGEVPFDQMRFHNGPPSLQDCLALVGVMKPVTSISAAEMSAEMRRAQADK